MITLNKEDTYKIIAESKRLESTKKKYNFTTKTKWKCLCCGTIIYVSYKQYGRNAIFCGDCWSGKSNNPTIVQFQYVKKLKDYQLMMMEKFLNDIPELSELKNIEKQLNND